VPPDYYTCTVWRVQSECVRLCPNESSQDTNLMSAAAAETLRLTQAGRMWETRENYWMLND